MSVSIPRPPRPAVVYPDSDGNPIAENTLQFEWIVTIKEGIDAVFRDEPDVFVAGDLLWYPVEGDPKTRAAPDTMVAFGRPKGYRGSYKQWEEGGIAPHVVFEVLSPGNRPDEVLAKFRFYERFGVEEYYVYDPDEITFSGWLRRDAGLEQIGELNGWTSPRLGVRFQLTEEVLTIIGPDGRRFLTFVELARERDLVEQQRDQAQEQRDQAQEQRDQAQQQRDQAQQQRDRETEQRILFEQQLKEEKQKRTEAEAESALERQRADLLAAKLRALGVDTETPGGT
jgi:Uma2 family endonuclease